MSLLIHLCLRIGFGFGTFAFGTLCIALTPTLIVSAPGKLFLFVSIFSIFDHWSIFGRDNLSLTCPHNTGDDSFPRVHWKNPHFWKSSKKWFEPMYSYVFFMLMTVLASKLSQNLIFTIFYQKSDFYKNEKWAWNLHNFEVSGRPLGGRKLHSKNSVLDGFRPILIGLNVDFYQNPIFIKITRWCKNPSTYRRSLWIGAHTVGGI